MTHDPTLPLVSLPATFPATVAALHRVAERVVAEVLEQFVADARKRSLTETARSAA